MLRVFVLSLLFNKGCKMQQGWVVVRGGGDLATGVIQKLYRAGLPTLVLETSAPLAIRRSVALCEAVYTGHAQVEDVHAQLIETPGQARQCLQSGAVPLLVDAQAHCLTQLPVAAVVDAILAKRNLGTNLTMAPVTVALGPGFTAGKDVHAVIETMRGHNLGRLILQGSAAPNTGVPGEIGGQSAKRVLHAPCAGVIVHFKNIGEVVRQGEVLFTVGGQLVVAPFTGLLRGLIRQGHTVPKGMKCADVDPRMDTDWHTISDKARCLGGAVLEAYLYLRRSC